MISFKNKKIEKLFFCFLIFSFIIMTLPRSIKSVSETIYYGLNFIKIFLVLILFIIALVKKIKITKFTKVFIIFMAFLLVTTIINKQSPVYYLKIYTFNFGALLLGELIYNSKCRNKILAFSSNYIFSLILINFADIICKKIFQFGFYSHYKTYILGIDNRFILYILISLIGYYYLSKFHHEYKWLLYISYIIGVSSLLLVWSASAMCVLLLVGLMYFMTSKTKKIKINPYVLLFIILSICFLIPFFKIHYLFKFFIVDILHKPLDLSYRVDVWDAAIKHILANPKNILYGFGFFDLTSAKYLAYALRIGHLHNIVINLLFYGGIIGLIIYLYNMFNLCKSFTKIGDLAIRNTLIVLFSGLMVLMIFDTFELYAIYYFIIISLYYSYDIFSNKYIYKSDDISRYKKTDDIVVSVCCITYNHEKYIRQMLDSILAQKTSFRYEIIVHDDASSDRTAKILKEYEKKYPNVFNNIYEKTNQYSKNVDVFGLTFKKAKGQYIAICEGDDYWCDDNKLQMQFEYMEKHQNCSLITTGATKYDDTKHIFTIKKQPYDYNRYYSTDEVIMWDGDLFATNSMFFRKKDVINMPDYYLNAPIKDYPLTIYLSLCGDVYYINSISSVYRTGVSGSWTNSMRENYIKNKEELLKKLSKMFDSINSKTNNVYEKSCQYVILKRELELLLLKREYKKIDKRKYKLLYKKGTHLSKIKNYIKVNYSFLYRK